MIDFIVCCIHCNYLILNIIPKNVFPFVKFQKIIYISMPFAKYFKVVYTLGASGRFFFKHFTSKIDEIYSLFIAEKRCKKYKIHLSAIIKIK